MTATQTYRTVIITPEQIYTFRQSWPCSGLPDVGCFAEYAPNGDLVNYGWNDGQDYWESETSGALVALLDDARDGKLA